MQDERPARLSHVEDNVRTLLPTSIFSSVRDSGLASPTSERQSFTPVAARNATLSSPSLHFTTPGTGHDDNVPGVLFPPVAYRPQDQAVSPDHPDLSDTELALYLQQKSANRQDRAWKRSKSQKHKRSKSHVSRCLVCGVSGIWLVAMVATCKSIMLRNYAKS